MPSRSALLALVVLVTAGCASTSAETGSTPGADRVEPATSAPVTITTTSLTSVFVPRPREIPLANVDPCLVWTPTQLGELGVSRTEDAGDPSPDTLGNPVCHYRGPREPVEIQYRAMISVQQDVEDLHGTAAARTAETVTVVAGFPAIQLARPAGSIDPCSVVVGTAAGQYLWIDLSVFPNDELTTDRACEMAMTAARMAMDTLHTIG